MASRVLAGAVLGIVIGLAGWWFKALSFRGALAAALVGTLIFGLGGAAWAVLLLAFFLSSSGLSRAFKGRKSTFEDEYAKGSRRDAGQVLANGGVGLLLVLVWAFFPGQVWVWVAYAGAFAAVNADTWATELGVLSPVPPRLLTTGQVVPGGTSGGVSLVGTLAAFLGAVFIALLAASLPGVQGSEMLTQADAARFWDILIAVSLGGLAGALFDSLLGATLQAVYYCPHCAKETERYPLHGCGTPTQAQRGWMWLNNDWVNWFCAAAGALAAAAIYGLLLL